MVFFFLFRCCIIRPARVPKPPPPPHRLSSCERHGTTGATRVRFQTTIAIVVATEIVVARGGEGVDGPESVEIYIYIYVYLFVSLVSLSQRTCDRMRACVRVGVRVCV